MVQDSTGTVHGVDPDGKFYIRLDEDEAEDDLTYTLYPFPNPQVEYLKVEILNVAKMTGVKRPRDPASVAPIGQVKGEQEKGRLSNDDLGRLFLDAKAQKASQNVKGGEGLRIPANITSKYEALYPPFWFARREAGEDREALWGAKLTELADRWGSAVLDIPHREELLVYVKYIVLFIHLPKPPKAREEWETAFTPVLSWLNIALQPMHTFKGIAPLIAGAKSTIKKGGLLDFEDLVTTLEAPLAVQPISHDFRPTPAPEAANIKRAVQDFLAFNANRGRGGKFFQGRRGRT